jgi:hypothetical protein
VSDTIWDDLKKLENDLNILAMKAAAEFDGKKSSGFRPISFPTVLEISLVNGYFAKYEDVEKKVKLCSITRREDDNSWIESEYEILIPEKELIVRIKI